MPNCSVLSCGIKKCENRPNITLHRLPVKEILRKKWIENIGLENINQKPKDLFVCSMHFEEKWFNRTLNITRLRDGAVPSSSLWPNLLRNHQIQSCPENEQQTPETNPHDTTSPSTTPNDIQIYSENEEESPEDTSSPSPTPNHIQIYSENEEESPEDSSSPSPTPNHIQISSENEEESLEETSSPSPTPNHIQIYLENEQEIPEYTTSPSTTIQKQNQKIMDLTRRCKFLKRKVKSLNQVVRRRNKKIAHYSKVIEDLIKIQKNQ